MLIGIRYENALHLACLESEPVSVPMARHGLSVPSRARADHSGQHPEPSTGSAGGRAVTCSRFFGCTSAGARKAESRTIPAARTVYETPGCGARACEGPTSFVGWLPSSVFLGVGIAIGIGIDPPSSSPNLCPIVRAIRSQRPSAERRRESASMPILIPVGSCHPAPISAPSQQVILSFPDIIGDGCCPCPPPRHCRELRLCPVDKHGVWGISLARA